MDKNEIKIIFSDLDRTLLRDDNTFSNSTIAMLEKVKKAGIKLVIATGRNIFSAKKVLSKSFPIDYLMFSAGCGIIDWQSKEVIYENHLSQHETKKIYKLFRKHEVDFMLHRQIPDNHKFFYVRTRNCNQDFERRIKLYEAYAESLIKMPATASQFIAIFKPDELAKFEQLKQEINGLQVIRATSPLDHKSIWLEIFPKGVSKGHSAAWLCKKLKIAQKSTVGIGNDFNDIDLLDFTRFSFVVENAPTELREIYEVIDSNQNDGFAKLIEKLFQEA